MTAEKPSVALASRSPHGPPAPSARTAAAVSRTLLAAAAVLGLTLAAYAPALQANYIWDDDDHVTKNPTLRSLDGLRQIWFLPTALPQYYPAVHTTFWLEYHLWGLHPVGYHLVNVLLHACNALLFWRLLVRLAVPGAWLAAAILAVHPVEVESVAWITERKNVLSLALSLAAILAYLRFSPFEMRRRRRSCSAAGRYGWYASALILFAVALLSKTVVASLPAVLLVLAAWKRSRIGRRDVAPLLPFFLLGTCLGLATVWLERMHVGAAGEEWDFTILDRVLMAGRALWFYAAKLAWPQPLAFFYPRWQVDDRVWWQYLFPFASLAVIAALWSSRPHRQVRWRQCWSLVGC